MVCKIIYRSVKPPFAGRALGPIIVIDPKYKDDRGLLAHEQVHVRQFWRTWGLHPLLYRASKRYRLAAELEAYRVQLKYAEDKEASARRFAGFIAGRYGLAISVEAAYRLIVNGLAAKR